jgi:dTDP-D-glucose 4,6-dehydratase
VLEISKIAAHTGWQPAQSFEQALQMTWDWYVANYQRVPVGQS